MFKKYGGEVRGDMFTTMSDEELLDVYKFLQSGAKSDIEHKNTPGSAKYNLPTEILQKSDRMSDEKIRKYSQKKVSEIFIKLNMVRSEIEKRGLKAPTMEERGM